MDQQQPWYYPFPEEDKKERGCLRAKAMLTDWEDNHTGGPTPSLGISYVFLECSSKTPVSLVSFTLPRVLCVLFSEIKNLDQGMTDEGLSRNEEKGMGAWWH